MARDFESFIVDPSLLDPSIDATNLRTTTDTRQELLSDVPDYAGIQFDPTVTSYLDDLYSLYSGQLPMTPTATTPAVGSPTDEGGGGGGGNIGTGSGGQATGGGLTQSGTFGGQPTFTTTPGTTVDDITGDITNPDGTYGGNIVDEVALTGAAPSGITGDPIDVGIPDNESGFIDPLGTMGGAPVVGDFDNPTTGTISDDRLNEVIGGQPMAAGPFDYLQQQTPISQVQVSGVTQADLTQAQIDKERLAGYTPSTSIAPETENALSQAFRTGKEALDSGMQTISQVGQSIADSVKGTYDDLEGNVNVPGLGEISIRDTLAGLAINAAVGAPVSFVKYAIDQIPPSASQLEYEGYTASQKAAVDEAFGPGGSMEGYNAVSQFGKGPVESIKDRINDIKNRKAPQTDASKQKINDLEQDLGKITGGVGNIFSAPTEGQTPRGSMTTGVVGLNTITDPNIDEEEGRPEDPGGSAVDFSAARTADNIAAATETLAGEYDAAVARGERTADSTITSAVNKAKAQIGMPQMLGDVGGSMDRGSTSSPGFSAPGQQGQQGQSPRGSTTGGGGDPGGGGRCVIATHAVNSGAFTKDTKREAVRWCVKNLHRTWWGEAIRKGYRYYGQKAIDEGKAENHYQEFKDYVAFGTGKRRTLKTGWTFVYRSVQFFIKGLING